MSDFQFAAPEWAYAFYALGVCVALLVWLNRRGSGALDRFVSTALRERLVRSPSLLRRRLRIALLALSAATLILALMRPQWGMRYVATPTFGSEIMICLDVSKSMLAEDVAPNRLERAKAELADLLTYMDGSQVGIIAFAGRATVLSPLTSDFSFLRLVLDNLGPHSVTRGGTRLEEPIRKSLKGFGAPGEAARAILLITDGEDQDSFAQDAAEEAAQLGVKIIAIGFGDERGSNVFVSNARTGARELIRDADGAPIRSRLDGDLLRSLALATDGAYVPAGTGLLDLESIYEQHIGRLTRGQLSERSKLVRDDIFQWFAMASLVFLVWSVAVSGGSRDPDSAGSVIAIVAASLLFPLLAGPLPAHARSEEPPKSLEGSVGTGEGTGEPAGDELSVAPTEPEDPREIYNQGIAALDDRDLEQADRAFRDARRDAAGDGVLRFHSAYNLGWTAADRAQDLHESEPETALQSLYEAADWFRESVRLRPEETASRKNLEVVLNRALLLADSIAKRDEGDLGAKLEALASAQREAVVAAADLLERVSETEGPHISDSLRPTFRANATSQRVLLADTDQLAKKLGDELEAIDSGVDAESAREDPTRAAQLEGVLHYLHRARERMGQARQQLRFRQAGRAYRRSAAALAELKRAEDQLRNPVELLDRLIESVTEITSYTSLLAASQSQLLATRAKPAAPAWLSGEYLLEEQQTAAERTGELHARLQSGFTPDSAPEAAESDEIEMIRSAVDSVDAGRRALEEAVRELESKSFPSALQAQIQAIAALRDAREHFLDLRGLIETIYADEKRMQAVLSRNGPASASVTDDRLKEFQPSLRTAQRKNLDRLERLRGLLEAETRSLSDPPEAGATAPDPQSREQENQRLLAADILRERVHSEMSGVLEALAPETTSFERASTGTDRAIYHLEGLRRIFFSTVERVREIAQRELELADSTQETFALTSGDSQRMALGPLGLRQQDLAERTEGVALALEEQSWQPDPDADPAVAQETSQRIRLAAEHLLLAHDSMREATTSLKSEAPVREEARGHQDIALAELTRALEQLVPPEQRPQDPQSGQDRDGEEPQEQELDAKNPQQPDSRDLDPAQLLQGVRDREAQRREERERRARSGYETVEKDW